MENTIEENKIYSLEEAAKLLGITERTLAEYCRLGTITARKVGEWKILGQALKDFLLQPQVNRVKEALQREGLTMKDGSPAVQDTSGVPPIYSHEKMPYSGGAAPSTDIGDIFEQGMKSTNTKGEFMDLTFANGEPAIKGDKK